MEIGGSHALEPAEIISKRVVCRDLILLALGAGILFGVALGTRDLWNPNEAIYGRTVVEMDERDDWLIPTMNGVVFAEKPILYYWAALAVSNGLGRIDELSLRIPAALAGVLSILLMYLLVQPYVGRRHALLTAALLATQYEVFWCSRAVQMDIPVLVTTLGMLLPHSRMLDFGLSPRWAWPMVGLVAGLGLLAKGPVTLVVPGLAFLVYCASSRRNPQVMDVGFALAGFLALAVAASWYGLLIVQGRGDILQEVLIRQNLQRFSNAWDHVQPWWYYLKYFWIEFAPWSFLSRRPSGYGLRMNAQKGFNVSPGDGFWPYSSSSPFRRASELLIFCPSPRRWPFWPPGWFKTSWLAELGATHPVQPKLSLAHFVCRAGRQIKV